MLQLARPRLATSLRRVTSPRRRAQASCCASCLRVCVCVGSLVQLAAGVDVAAQCARWLGGLLAPRRRRLVATGARRRGRQAGGRSLRRVATRRMTSRFR